MKKIFLIAILLISTTFMSCTDNKRVKTFGGKATLKLPINQKLINITWKDNEIWYLTRPMIKEDYAETYVFQEKSQFGVAEGTYILQEIKDESLFVKYNN